MTTSQKLRSSTAFFLGLFALSLATGVQAEFFRWTDEQGKTYYSDRPTVASQKITVHAGHAFYRVKKVYDGDTITLKGGERVRLLGINTPEIESRHRQGEPGGIKARNWLREQLKNQKVRLEKDQTKRDKYGRTLAHVFTESGTHINVELVRLGLASSNIYPPSLKYSQKLLQAQREAEKSKRGIWGIAAYAPQPINKLSNHKNSGWKRLIGVIKSLKRGRKFDRLIFSRNIDLRIPTKNRALFPALKEYIGKKVEVRGWPSRRKTHYSILVRHPSALIVQ